MGQTLFGKIWDSHVAVRRQDGSVALHVDRHMVHDLMSQIAFDNLKKAGRPVRSPELTFATHDHLVSSRLNRTDSSYETGADFIRSLRLNTAQNNIKLFGLGDPLQGIVHVIAPELGITLPGLFLVCGDSHTCTNGGIGALAIGIGTSDVEHVLATQTLIMREPKTMRIIVNGYRLPSVTAKDIIMAIIGRLGVNGASGHAVEYSGTQVQAMTIEERLTLCNMSIEMGARIGIVAPDDTTFAYLADKPYAPRGEMWDRALTKWRSLPSDEDCHFDSNVTLALDDLKPQVTWGTTPAQVLPVDGRIPDPAQQGDATQATALCRALEYMGLQPGQAIAGQPVDKAFIGSCTNGRLSDLRAAARILKGRKVASHVHAIAVPGSTQVKNAAEAEGLDKIFQEAGFEWRSAACSMCAGANDDQVGAGQRCISTSNRNFEGRQGVGARTHLASPLTVAASAISGKITDVRPFLD